MQYFGEHRTSDGKGVTIASQKRYVGYYAQYLATIGHRGRCAPADAPVPPVGRALNFQRVMVRGRLRLTW